MWSNNSELFKWVKKSKSNVKVSDIGWDKKCVEGWYLGIYLGLNTIIRLSKISSINESKVI